MEPPSTHDTILRVADTIGELMEFWGFKRNMGRIWTLLYLAPEPLSAAQICQRLSLSSGAVSMLLSELLRWDAVKKHWVPGDRRDYYTAETSIWKMVSRVFRERELRKIISSIEIFEEAVAAVAAQRASAAAEDAQWLTLAQERIQGLLSLARIGERLLNSILSGKPVDPAPLRIFDED